MSAIRWNAVMCSRIPGTLTADTLERLLAETIAAIEAWLASGAKSG